MHLLALNPAVQAKLRYEVTLARSELGDMDYDALMNLPYLDAVCRETLRVFPPNPFQIRVYVLGQDEKNFELTKLYPTGRRRTLLFHF